MLIFSNIAQTIFMRNFYCLLILLIADITFAQISEFIHIDQFGYLRDSDKIAVISNPGEGFNSNQSYQAGSVMEVRKVDNDEVVFTGELSPWNSGQLHAQSGDYGWWFDFGAVVFADEYYLFDPMTGERSANFKIGPDVYDEVLQTAFKAFYYNRCNAPKEEPYADSRWTDRTNFLWSNQDSECLYIYDKDNESLKRDLSGGWFDAGDYNKYVTFAVDPIHNLLWAYQENPTLFTDDWNIPESGNGLPDILDEVKWELDWLMKMNNEDGSTIIKMGSQNHSENISAPPSLNLDRRFYGPTCSAASIAVASMFAHGAKVFSSFPEYESYADELESRAITSWDYAQNFAPSNFETACDDGSIISGDADWDANKQKDNSLTSALYLFDLTRDTKYDDYIRSNYRSTEQLTNNFWGPYKMPQNDALLNYASLSIATESVSNDILNSFGSDVSANNNGYYGFTFNDLYRAHIPEWSYHWGSNQPKANYGILNHLVTKYLVFDQTADTYKDYQRDAVHYFHGVNPMGLVYLSGMYEYGGERCANEIYHTWFADGSNWDNSLNSAFGPAPGFVVGGPNKDFSLTNISPPSGQPPMKSYLDFNTGWPDNSWEITEPAIYYQAAYIRMLSGIMSDNATTSVTNKALNDLAIDIYPNPSLGIFNVAGEIDGKTIRVFNPMGQQLLLAEGKAKNVRLDLTSFESGVYFISVVDELGQSRSIQKLVKL